MGCGSGSSRCCPRSSGGSAIPAVGGSRIGRCCAGSCSCCYTGDPVGVPAAGAGVRLGHDVLAAAGRSGMTAGVWQQSARGAAGRVARRGQAGLVPGGDRRLACAGAQGRPKTGPSPVDRARTGLETPRDHRRRGHPAGGVSLTGGNRNDVTQLLAADRGHPAGARQTRTAPPPARAALRRPRLRPRQVHRRAGPRQGHHARTSPAAAPNTAPAWACTAGWSNRPSRCCTGSAGYASAGRSATTSTKPSSAWPARSSATGASSDDHSVRSSK